MQRFLLPCLSLFLLFAFGCSGKVMSQPRPASYYEKADLYTAGQPAASLFPSDSSILSDSDIKKILAFKYQPRRLNRIAILPISQIQWFGWSDDLDKAGAAVQSTLLEKLKQSNAVYDAAYLPALLIPGEKSIGRLREAAARFQSDLLLIYKASFANYEKSNVFSPDKTKAYCNLEAVLLDTRTGIVPFTLLVSRTFSAEEQKEDINFYETIRRTELYALESALTEVGEEIVKFLSEAPKIQ